MRILATIVLIIAFSVANAQDGATLFQQANEAFSSKKYKDAITKYEAVISKGLVSDALYYNLGNAYYKVNQPGKAIYNFEMALLYNPSNKDAKFNLETANAKLTDEIAVLPVFFLTRWWKGLRSMFSSTIWGVLALLGLWLFAAGVAGWLLYTDRSKKKRAFLGAMVGLTLSVLLLTLAFQRWSEELDSGYAIIIEPIRPLHSAPDAESAEVLTLHEGTKVQLLGDLSGWHKIRLVNGEQGWLPEASLGRIKR